MKVTLKLEKEFEVSTLHVRAGVRYWEDSHVNGVEDESGNLIPCRNGENWMPVIDVDSGKILNWTPGTTANVHYKVCDNGTYELKDAQGSSVISINGYVPRTMSPAENGYGDYIIMKVDDEGKIENWKLHADDFQQY